MTILECHRVVAALIKEPLKFGTWGLHLMLIRRWMEATARLDQAGAEVQRRPRAVFVSEVDKHLGISVPNEHLFWQTRLSYTRFSRWHSAWVTDELIVLLLPEREVDWPPGLA